MTATDPEQTITVTVTNANYVFRIQLVVGNPYSWQGLRCCRLDFGRCLVKSLHANPA